MATFDHIIIGAGSAGCVLAEGLSADGRASVLLLEAGGSDRRFWIRTPIGYGMTLHDPAVNWRFMAEPDRGLAGRRTYVPRGKVLGGSSSINAMVYCRGLPTDFDDWRDFGNSGWGWSDVAPVFARIEHIDQTSRTGLSVVNREQEYHSIRRHFLAAAQEAGLPLTSDLNGPEPEGVCAYAITTRAGLRCSAADAFLRPALKRPNLEVVTGAFVTRIRLNGRRAVGVDVLLRGVAHGFNARCGVILAAGAIKSPHILQLSGIGPGHLLQSLGIPVVVANDAVGGNLQDHVGVNYAYRATEPTLNSVLGTQYGRLRAGARFLFSRSGPLSLSVNQMGGLVRSSNAAQRPDTQLYFNPLSYSAAFVGERPILAPDPFPGFILSFNACRPTSTGRVEAASPDPVMAPRIETNYLSTEADIANVLAGARLIGRLQATAALRKLIDGPPPIDLNTATDELILSDFRARAGSVYHPCGTARMAPLDRAGVVDAQLRVHGLEGLRVIDASAFPNVTSGNTNAPTMMLARRAVDLMLAGA